MCSDDQGRPIRHPGYYWLAYDWRNLLPACVKCNQPAVISGRKVGKHNRFPVGGRHAQQPHEVAAEEPLLIHPASGRPEDDPERHLMVDTNTGVMGHHTERGRVCIDIFALNLRTWTGHALTTRHCPNCFSGLDARLAAVWIARPGFGSLAELAKLDPPSY